jgi:hypothetical protein
MPRLHPEIALYCAQTSLKTQVQFIAYSNVRAEGASQSFGGGYVEVLAPVPFPIDAL